VILFFIFIRGSPSTQEPVHHLQFDFYARSSVIPRAESFQCLLPTPPTQRIENESYNQIFFVPFSLLKSSGQDRKSLSDIGTVSNSNESLNLIDRWFTECVRNHELCKDRRGQGDHPSPRRLVDVGTQQQGRIHLHMIENKQNFNDEYITLSHRWGSIHQLTLTKDTVNELVAGIAPEILPKSFKDAIMITQQLGIRYLWIDSLCIFQDSKDDWMQEAANMGSIYRHALLNIAATSAYDSNGGLFFDRDPLQVQPIWISMPFGLYYLEPHSNLVWDFICVEQGLENILDMATLNTRGWVVQERILSRRILHCHKSQLFWECKTKTACETLPEEIRNCVHGTIPQIIRLLDRLEDETEHRLPSDERGESVSLVTFSNPNLQNDVHRAWLSTIERYSACDLTNQEDKLVAISAIAKLLESYLADKYLAGIFQSQLGPNLLWYVVGRENSSPDSSQPIRYGDSNSQTPWLAPSWSWASIKGTVAWDDEVVNQNLASLPRLTYLFNLLDAHATNTGLDGTGQLSDAWLKLEAAVCFFDVRLDVVASRPRTLDLWRQYNGTGSRERMLHFKIREENHWGIAEFDEPKIITILTESFSLVARLVPEIAGPSWISIPSIPLIAAQFYPVQGFPQSRFKIQGLLLHGYSRRPNHPTGFERIGRFTITSNNESVLRFFENAYDTRKKEILLL